MIFMLNVPSWCEKGAGVGLSLKCASLKIKPFHRFLFGAFFFPPLTDCRCESFASFYLQKKFSEKQIPHRSQFSGINEYNQRGFSLRHRNMNRNKINCRSVYRIFIRSKNVPGAGWDVASWLELVMWKQSFYVWKWRLRQWDGTKELRLCSAPISIVGLDILKVNRFCLQFAFIEGESGAWVLNVNECQSVIFRHLEKGARQSYARLLQCARVKQMFDDRFLMIFVDASIKWLVHNWIHWMFHVESYLNMKLTLSK